MNLEGRIDIQLALHAGAAATVSIASSRPQLAQKLLAGRTPAEAAHLAGLIFSLCGKAQRVAAAAACAAAQGLAPEAAVLHAHEAAVQLESAQEHAWRLLLDWPQQQGLSPDQASQLRLRQSAADPQRFAETLAELLRSTLLGEPAAVWLARDLAGFDAWRRAGGTQTARLFAGLAMPAARKEHPGRRKNELRGEGADIGISQVELLPPLSALDEATARDLARRALATPAFCSRPLWRDAPAETGAIARTASQPLLAAWIAQRGRGAGARLLARLLELAALPGSVLESSAGGAPVRPPALVRAWSLGDNSGLAGVETSRGLLLHVVRLHADQVAEYRIVAPTEWNFHPAGPLAQALAQLDSGPGLAAQARLVAQSLDPCVAFAIEVKNA